MKKAIVGLFVAMFAMLAFAMPSPKQIEDALAAKNYADAKSMLQEVLREKPDSARAHLMNAYLLAHVDRNKVAANAELQTAVGLDKKGDIKSSPLFGRVVAEIDMQPAAKPKSQQPTTKIWEVLFAAVLVIAAVGLILMLVNFLLDRPRSTVFYRLGGGDGGLNVSAPPSAPASPSSGGVHYQHAATTILQTQANPAMGAFGTAASVAGGVVAGNMLSEALFHGHRHHHSDYEDTPRRRSEEVESTYTPSPVSYENERSSFSSGSGSSWSSSDSGSSWSSDSGSSDSSSSWD